jgi:hypothetical protein
MSPGRSKHLELLGIMVQSLRSDVVKSLRNNINNRRLICELFYRSANKKIGNRRKLCDYVTNSNSAQTLGTQQFDIWVRGSAVTAMRNVISYGVPPCSLADVSDEILPPSSLSNSKPSKKRVEGFSGFLPGCTKKSTLHSNTKLFIYFDLQNDILCYTSSHTNRSEISAVILFPKNGILKSAVNLSGVELKEFRKHFLAHSQPL